MFIDCTNIVQNHIKYNIIYIEIRRIQVDEK